MFDIGWSELVLIGVVALIVIGPKELPGVLRAVGHWTGKIRRMAAEFQGQFNEAMREAEMADLKKQVDEINDAARSIGRLDPLTYEPVKGAAAASPPAGESAPGLAAPAAEGLSRSAADMVESAPAESSPPQPASPPGEAARPETSAEPAQAAAASVPGEAGSGIRPA